MDEKQLIKELKNKNQHTINSFYENQYHSTKTVLKRIGCTDLDFEEVYNDSIISLLWNIKTDKFQGQSKISTYLTSIAKFKFLNKVKKKKKKLTVKIPKNFEQIEEHLGDDMDEIENIIQKKFESLDPKCKKILSMSTISSKSLKLIADELNYTYDFIRQKKRRCLDQLKKQLLNENIIRENYG